MTKNVILITIDGARLDRVKKSNIFNKHKSVFFSQCVTYGPHTIAAMHAIFSGSYGTRTGTNSYWSTYKFKKDQFQVLTKYLKENGYFTLADVHSEIVIPKQGFDEFVIYEQDKNLIQRHLQLLKKMKERENYNNQKFFLYLHYDKIHASITDTVLKKYTNFSKEYFENRVENEKYYDKLFHDAEFYVDQVLTKIEELGFLKNSIIIIISDHGVSIGEKFGERAYGAFCYDYTLTTFCYFLGDEFRGKEISQQVRTVDFMPTILDYLQIPLNKKFNALDGESLRPLIEGYHLKEKIAYSETGNPLIEKEPPKIPNIKSVRTSKWKLIYKVYDNSNELYNLETDPCETINLAGTGLEIENILWNELQKLQTTDTT